MLSKNTMPLKYYSWYTLINKRKEALNFLKYSNNPLDVDLGNFRLDQIEQELRNRLPENRWSAYNL